MFLITVKTFNKCNYFGYGQTKEDGVSPLAFIYIMFKLDFYQRCSYFIVNLSRKLGALENLIFIFVIID